MSLIAHHYFPLGSDNIGDHLVAHAIRHALARHLGPVRFVDMPVNDRYRNGDRSIGLLGENVDRTNSEADLVVVGGSNLLEPRRPRREKPGRTNWSWGVFTNDESLARLAPPVLLLGMGTGSDFGKSIRPYSQTAIPQIRKLHEQAIASAVRDQTTVDRLAEIGVHTTCTGCPVTFLTNRPVAKADSSLPLLVSLPPSRILKRITGRLFMSGAVRYVRWLEAQGVPIVVTLHETNDLAVARQYLPKSVEVFYTEDVDELIARYEQSQGVVGFRLHAALLGLGLGKPVLPVGVDWRGQAFVETFGLQRISIRPGRLGQFRKLRACTEQLLAGDAELITLLSEAKAHFGSRYEAFLSRAATKLESSCLQDKLLRSTARERMVNTEPLAPSIREPRAQATGAKERHLAFDRPAGVG